MAQRLATVCTQMLALGGCPTPKERQAAENAARDEQVAQEIERICALHGAKREAAPSRQMPRQPARSRNEE